MDLLFKLWQGWKYSEIYYEPASHGFIEKRYHLEYLDNGTVFDGENPIDDVKLWKQLVFAAHDEGIKEYLKIRGSAPEFEKSEGLSQEAFNKRLRSFTPSYSVDTVGETKVFFVRNENIVGVLTKADSFWCYIDSEKQGFHTEGEALEYIIEKISQHHARLVHNEMIDKVHPVEEPKKKKSFKEKLFG